MKKGIVLLMATMFAAFVMTSCGGGNNSKSAADKAETVKKEVKKEVEKHVKKDDADISSLKADVANGEKVYKKYCIACHMTGVAGAAKLDNKKRWEESAAKGMQTLVNHAFHGYTGEYGALPEKGTCMECKTQDILDAVSYMLQKAGVTAK